MSTRTRRLQFKTRTVLLAFIPIAVLCLWPGRIVVTHLVRRHAFQRIRATDGTVLESERGFVLKLDRSQLVHLATLVDVGSLDLAQSSLTDGDLTHLRPLHELVFLDLSENPISDTGLAAITGCEKLRFLALQDTHITSDGLKHLARMKELENLILDGTLIDDRAISHLRNCSMLRELSLHGTAVTDDSIKYLTLLPNLSAVSVPAEWAPEHVERLKSECPNLKVFQQRVTIPR